MSAESAPTREGAAEVPTVDKVGQGVASQEQNAGHASSTDPTATTSGAPEPTADGSRATPAQPLTVGNSADQSSATVEAEKPSKPNTAESTASTSNANGNKASDLPGRLMKKISKSSLVGRRRSGSMTGSRRANKAATTPGPTTAPQSEQPRPAKSKGGFLSFLSCCGASSPSDDVEMEHAIPAPTADGLRPIASNANNRGQDASAAESSTAESKDLALDKIGGTPYSDLKSAGEPRMQDPLKTSATATSKSSRSGATGLASGAQYSGQDRSGNETPRAEMPADEPGTVPESGPLNSERNATALSTEQGATIEETTINDRTPHQMKQDTDTEMSDAPPASPPLAETKAVEEEETPTQLPPPPPRREASSASQRERVLINQAGASGEQQKWLLPPIRPEMQGRKCLILDLDETLVHSSFKILHQADFTIPVEIEGQYHNVYVIKRPGVDHFMKRVGELYEVVVFTASVSKYGDPLLDQLDIHGVVHHRLFRESCYNHQGNYVKVGRDLPETIIIDNSPTSYIFHPQHAVPISSWFSDAHDNELLDLIPVLEDLAGPQVRDVSLVLDVTI